MVSAGALNRRIAIQSQSSTTELDAFQQPTTAAWNTIYRCWASIDIQNSALVYSTAEFMSRVVYRITIRWTSSVVISAQQRIVYTEPTTKITHTYVIESAVNDKQANQQITLLCYELEGEA
jgi:head-tail adaptor